MIEGLEQKIKYLKSSFPIDCIVIAKDTKIRHKVRDYRYSADDDRLVVRTEALVDHPFFNEYVFDYFVSHFELMKDSQHIKKDEFLVTNEHLQLLANSYVYWDDCEFGAPGIDPKRPFGNSDVEKDYEEITGKPYNDVVYKQLETCLQILIDNLSIHAGLYRYDKEDNRWYEA